MSRTWVFNNNEYTRRGVWHLPTADIQWIEVPEKTVTTQQEVRRYHDNKCEGKSVYVGSSQHVTGCTCGIGETNYIQDGHYTRVQHYPTYRRPNSQRVSTVCNQVDIRVSEYVEFPWNWTRLKKIKDGEVYEQFGKPPKFYSYEGDTPPGPVCSRCLKKAINN